MVIQHNETLKSKKGLLLFLSIYGVLTLLMIIGMILLLNPLNKTLSAYEAAQIKNQAAQTFNQLFSDPNWKNIYDLSETADTPFENWEDFVSYMETKVGDEMLTYREVLSSDSEKHKYQVLLEGEPIAGFTMVDDSSPTADLPQWTLGGVEILAKRSVSITVEKLPEHTVYINGVALDDSFTVRTVETKAEPYLPQDVHGYRRVEQQVDGLMVQPEILVLDENGTAVPIELNRETGIYTLQFPTPADMSDAEELLIRNAAIADAIFSMRGIGAAQLKAYFDEKSQIYRDLITNPIFIQKNNGFTIDENAVKVSNFYRFDDDTFCANVKLTVNVTRKDNSLKKYQLDKTYFFSRSSSGKMLVSNYTNEPALEQIEHVRLTFAVNDEASSVMFNPRTDTLVLPEITSPEGQMLTGWATQEDNDSGTVTMTVHILPTGAILGKLEPMTLYPVFESAS